MSANITKPRISIIGSNFYRLQSNSGQTYAVRNGVCGGSDKHRPSDKCKHARFVKDFTEGLERARRVEAERRERQRVNGRMFDYFYG